MNIIYKLTNKSKSTFPNKYVGSKTNCKIETINGIPTIVSLRNGGTYYSSATCPIFKQDLTNGHEFHAEILEIISDKDTLQEEEYKLLSRLDVAHSEEYYNKSNGIPRARNYIPQDKEAIVNRYGELQKDFNGSKTMQARRDKTATDLGFDNFAMLSFHIYEQHKLLKTYSDISKELGQSNRHFSDKFISIFNIPKALEDIQKTNLKEKVRNLYTKERVSLTKISELLDIDLVASRYFLSSLADSGTHSTLYRRLNNTEDELIKYIMDSIGLDGKSIREVTDELGTCTKPVHQYLIKGIKDLYTKYNIEK